MRVRVDQLRSQVQAGGVVGKVMQFPVVRMLAASVFVVPFLIVHNKLIGDAIAATREPVHSILVDIDAAVSVCIILLLYRLYARVVERRPCHEVSTGGAPGEVSRGALLAAGIISLTVVPMTVSGCYGIESTGSPEILVHSLFFFAIGALIQELAFRLILFRLLEEMTGTWLALGLVAIAFASAHGFNPNATAVTLVAVAAGDVLLSACFIHTRRIWLVWGFHAGWNYLQDGILGMPNSGVTEFDSWISPEVSGPIWLTGGSFGIEMSWVALIASAAAAVWLLRRAGREGQIVRPVWRREGRDW
jgi:membrane protease YdiL (CAAX protease family)